MTAPVEMLVLAEETPQGGYIARALGTSIVTEADDLPTLRMAVRNAVRGHFGPGEVPKQVRLCVVRDEILVV